MPKTPALLCVAPHLVEGFLPFVEPMLDDAYRIADELMPSDLREKLMNGHMCLWVIVNGDRIYAAGLTQIELRRSGKTLRIVALGGRNFSRWRQLHHDIEQYAKREGCDKVRFDGRSGWGRVLPGYNVVSVTHEKRI